MAQLSGRWEVLPPGLGSRRTAVVRAVVAAAVASLAVTACSGSGDGATTGESPTVSPITADGVGDSRYPSQGNPGYDVGHYTIDLVVDVPSNTIDGSTTIQATATQDLPRFNLDLLGLKVTAAEVDGGDATVSRKGQEMTVTPSARIPAGTAFDVEIRYEGTPTPYADPAFSLDNVGHSTPFHTGWNRFGADVLATMGQPDGAMNWFPSNNHPSDKATYTFRISVEAPYVAVANGTLAEVVEEGAGRRTYVWEMADPIATNVSLVAIGQFERREATASNGIPIRNYFPKDSPPDLVRAFDVTDEAMTWLEDLLGPYPFDEYGVVVVPDFRDVALEAATMSVFDDFAPEGPDETVVVHELAHQWWGNTLTLGDWGDIWLHEGFATYFGALWIERQQGTAAYNGYMQMILNCQRELGANAAELFGRPALPPGGVFSPEDPAVEMLFDQSYCGGALVLHALRLEVGGETLRRTLRTFYDTRKDRPVRTEDFLEVAEQVAGRDLDPVWESWLYGTTTPARITPVPASDSPGS